jgi:hypothetical protein
MKQTALKMRIWQAISDGIHFADLEIDDNDSRVIEPCRNRQKFSTNMQ